MPNEILKALAVIAAQLQIQNEIATGTEEVEVYDGDTVPITSLKSVNILTERFMQVFAGEIEESDFTGYDDGMDRRPLSQTVFWIQRGKRK